MPYVTLTNQILTTNHYFTSLWNPIYLQYECTYFFSKCYWLALIDLLYVLELFAMKTTQAIHSHSTHNKNTTTTRFSSSVRFGFIPQYIQIEDNVKRIHTDHVNLIVLILLVCCLQAQWRSVTTSHLRAICHGTDKLPLRPVTYYLLFL